MRSKVYTEMTFYCISKGALTFPFDPKSLFRVTQERFSVHLCFPCIKLMRLSFLMAFQTFSGFVDLDE